MKIHVSTREPLGMPWELCSLKRGSCPFYPDRESGVTRVGAGPGGGVGDEDP